MEVITANLFPDLNGLKHLYIKSLEEFDILDTNLTLGNIYVKLKNSKMMYRVSINKLNIL